MKKALRISLTIMMICSWSAKGQDEIAPLNTGAANFLLISPDARTAALAGASTALAGHANSIYTNAAGAGLGQSRSAGVMLSGTPWTREGQSGYFQYSLGGYYNIDGNNTILAGFRQMFFPKVSVFEDGVATGERFRPAEFSVDLGYSRRIMDGLAASLAAKFIHSKMGGIGEANNAGAVAFDVGLMYKRDFMHLEGAAWSVGFNISNLGTRIKYLDTKEHLPAIAKLGGAVEVPFADIHRILIAADAGYRISPEDTRAASVSAGLEYSFMDCVLVRGGYHYGDKDKADASYGTAGLGFKCHNVGVDFTWLFAEKEIAYRNTFWISLGFFF